MALKIKKLKTQVMQLKRARNYQPSKEFRVPSIKKVIQKVNSSRLFVRPPQFTPELAPDLKYHKKITS